MTDLAKIRARESDPAVLEHAQRVSEKIIARLDVQRLKLFASMADALAKPADAVGALRHLAGELASAARDLVPCSRGCSKCCHMPTMLSVEEAAVIAKETGADLATPAEWFDGENVNSAFDGVPCPFLKNDTCSIYARRPFACRLHIHLDRDNTLCEVVPGESIRVPRLDTLQFDLVYARRFGGPLAVKLADIREFFPKGLGK